ncbi:MAG: helix-hairpin-helix domain-containing protein [Ktedonobacteraceae bacterium]
MKTQWQFQNPMRQEATQDEIMQIVTVIQPNITLPVRRESLMLSIPAGLYTAEQQTPILQDLPEHVEASVTVSRKKKLWRNLALIFTLLLGFIIYFTWRSMTAIAAPPTVLQQNYSNTPSPSVTPNIGNVTVSSVGNIVVYILGSITHPGVYNLPADARVYQLVQAAGGLLPNANAVALNMAAKLTDGEEIYVLAVGEVSPVGINTPVGTSNGTNGTPSTLVPGQLVNINTASETDMRQALHVSAATAQKIITYRTQHGPYTAVAQLLQVISQSIYARIKGLVTV